MPDWTDQHLSYLPTPDSCNRQPAVLECPELAQIGEHELFSRKGEISSNTTANGRAYDWRRNHWARRARKFCMNSGTAPSKPERWWKANRLESVHR